MVLNYKLINKKNSTFKNSKLFALVYSLGKTINLKSDVFNSLSIISNYDKKLVSFKLNYLTQILRIQKLHNLNQFLLFNVFFFNNIQKNILGFNQKFKRSNSLKNNFKLFIYSLYNYSNFSYNSFNEPLFLNNSNNNYFPYSFNNEGLNSNKTFVYNFLFSDNYNLSNLSNKLKFNNYSYLRSNKKKRFKKKESEKLAALRENLEGNKENSLRLKFYYKFYEHRRLHSYWNKEEFLKKKFKYFNPGKNSFLLHFFYNYRKNRSLTNKYDLFTKKWFVNFWLQAKLRKYSLSSYKTCKKNSKSQLKFISFYFNQINKKNNLFNNNKISFNQSFKRLNLKLKENFSDNILKSLNLKKNIPNNLLLKIKNSSLLNKNQFNSILNYDGNTYLTSKIINKALNKYNKFKSLNLNSNDHIFFNNIKIKNFRNFNRLPSTYKYNNYAKKRGKPYFFLNNVYSDYSDKKAFYNYAKKSKSFRKKVKYWNWLDKQKNLKLWKFNKFLIQEKLINSNFKKNILSLNDKKNYMNKKNPKIIFSNKLNFRTIQANSEIKNWFYHDLSNFNKLNSNNLNYFLRSISFICSKYEKNFHNYRSNRILNKKYSYMNLFKGFKIFKKRNQSHFFISKLSKKIFFKSWSIVKKNYKKKRKFSFLNLVPSYNRLFISRVLKLYKSVLFSKLLNSNFINGKKISESTIKNYFKFKISRDITLNKNIDSLNYNKSLLINNLNISMIDRVKNIRLIDKNFGFNKRKEKEFKSKISVLKTNKYLFKNKLLTLDNNIINNDINKLKDNLVNNISIINKKINNSELTLKILFNSKKKISKKNNELNYYNFKNNKFKYSSFYCYLQSLNFKRKNNSFDNFYNQIILSNSKFINNKLNYFSFISNIKKKNLNNIRKILFKKIKNKKLQLNLNNLLSFRNKKLLNKFKLNNIVRNNLSLNNLLQKNYNIYLKLFKYFNLYKKANTFDYFWGFGKLWNYCNVNHDNIFSWFNFLNYNFLNYNHWKSELGISNDHFGNVRHFDKIKTFWKSNSDNLRKIELLFPLDSEEKFEEFKLRCSSPIDSLYPSYDKVNNNSSSSILEYDIINKSNKLFRILYAKNSIVKYSSIMNNNLLPFLLKLLKNKSNSLVKYSITSRYKVNSSYNFIYESLNSEKCITNWFILKNHLNKLNINNSLLLNDTDKPFKKVYFGILKGYNTIFN